MVIFFLRHIPSKNSFVIEIGDKKTRINQRNEVEKLVETTNCSLFMLMANIRSLDF